MMRRVRRFTDPLPHDHVNRNLLLCCRLVVVDDVHPSFTPRSQAPGDVAIAPTLPRAAIAKLEVKIGRPAAVLADAGADAQLVVVGAKVHGALARGMGGSTAHHLVRTIDTPVLVTMLGDAPIRRVLAAVDLSFATEPTIEAARGLARRAAARLRILHVVEPVRATRVTARVDREAPYRAAIEGFAHYTGPLSEVASRDRVIRRGPAADIIESESEKWEADVVVVGSHGKGWVERLLVGSVTERLLALLPASLLIVPVRQTAQPKPRPRRPRPRAGKSTIIV